MQDKRNRVCSKPGFEHYNVQNPALNITGGFTLIELLVSIGIIVLLSSLVLFNWKAGSQNLALTRAASQVSQHIRKAQELSLSGKPAPCFATAAPGSILGYGVFFAVSTPYSFLFANCDAFASYLSGVDEVIESKSFEQGITVVSTSPSGFSVLFVPPVPEVRIEPGGLLIGSVVLQNSAGKLKTIQINTKGVIEILP